MAPKQKLLKLPKSLIEQLGGEDVLSGGRKSTPRAGSRKELRKAARVEKKSARTGPPAAKRTKIHHEEDRASKAPVKKPQAVQPLRDHFEDEPRPNSILKRANYADPEPKKPRKHRSVSPPTQVSRAVQDKLAEDDAEIAALEKKLGLKGKKGLPKSFNDDGLDELLEGLGGKEEEGEQATLQKRKRKAEGDEWLKRKRSEARNAAKGTLLALQDDDEEDEGYTDVSGMEDNEVEEGDEADDDDGASDMSLDGPAFPNDASDDDDGNLGEEDTLHLENDFDSFYSADGSDDGTQPSEPPKRVRENPYVAPSTETKAPSGKYVPPSLRKSMSSDSEELIRLRRRTQGLVNRLTEANLIPILGDIEKIYRENPRQHVTSTLVDILLTSICEPTSLPDTLIILPAGFISAIYKIIGTDFGAQVIQRIVALFDEHYARAQVLSNSGPAAATSDSSKETSNLIMLLSELYNFQVIGSNLVFDYIGVFLERLSELNAELLLKIIRASGPQLRQDDPSALKGIIAMLRPAIEGAGGETNISVRTKFMIETINDLKNNRMKTGGAASAITSEHTIRMKKILGSLNTRSIRGSEPLRIGLKDIRESDKKGKWWLVGASWAGNVDKEVDEPTSSGLDRKTVAPAEDAGAVDLVQLAREQRMNTDIRRAIFVTIMSATDFQDAYQRLMKLKLKKVQEFEIPKVLIHCAGGEKSYNPYYTLIAKKVCGDRRIKTAFQYCLWDLFRKMGESEEGEVDPEDEEETLQTRQIVNLAKMFGTLLVGGGLALSALKNLNFSYLRAKTKIFMEVFFITIILESQKQTIGARDEQAIVQIFSHAKETPQLIRGLQYFHKKVVSKTDIAGGKDETAIVKWACKVVGDTLALAVDA
ncbi:glycerol defect protein 1 suppressor [Diplocarpon rosae]|nr:glycerol defect protein 1 suppressor [Diplocarpon rosae]